MEKNQMIDSLSTSSSTTFYNNYWFWIAVAELLIIVVSIFYIRRIRKGYVSTDLKKKVMSEGPIDFNNTMMSAFHAQELYNELKVKYHPDRFPNDKQKNLIATALFQQIVENKNNYNKLIELKALAQEKLSSN